MVVLVEVVARTDPGKKKPPRVPCQKRPSPERIGKGLLAAYAAKVKTIICVWLWRNRDMTSAQPSPGDKDPIPSYITKIWIIFITMDGMARAPQQQRHNAIDQRPGHARPSFPRPFANGVCQLMSTL